MTYADTGLLWQIGYVRVHANYLQVMYALLNLLYTTMLLTALAITTLTRHSTLLAEPYVIASIASILAPFPAYVIQIT